MIPLIAAGAVSLASNVIDAWKAHAETTANAQAAKNADFQKSLKTAAAELSAATEKQKQQALPADLQSVTQQITQAPDFQSLARSSSTGSVNLQFNSNGDLFASQPGGGMRRIVVGTNVQQQLQQLNGTLRNSTAGGHPGRAQVETELASSHLPVQVNLSAV